MTDSSTEEVDRCRNNHNWPLQRLACGFAAYKRIGA